MPPRSGPEPDAQWPPRSPHEVLLGTPGGRERLRRLAERASPSPSPSKRGRSTPALAATSASPRHGDDGDLDVDIDEDEDDDEDEEMLQLKLAAIQAKLRLKKLQSAKARKGLDTETTSSRSGSAPIPDAQPASRAQSRASALRSGQTVRPQSQVEVQVPASPTRRAQTAQGPHTSPSRVRLGIDKGLRAKDISLKRAPSLKKPQDSQNSAQGGYLRRAHTTTVDTRKTTSSQERPKTFSERLAEARTEESSRQERQAKIKQIRSNAFELGKQDMEQFKNNATEIPDIPSQSEQFSRDEVVAGGSIKRSNTTSGLRRPTQDESRSASSLGTPEPQQQGATSHKKKVAPSEVPEEEASAFEPYSSVHLSKRIIPHPVLTRNLSGKKTYMIKDLLKHVKAPDFELPDIEQDIVVFGILASKSEPRAHKNTGNLKEKAQTDPDRGKYMILKLVDLQWELELFLFNSGFERYWKLTPGTLVAILNPSIMPPPPGRTDTGRFSLVINSGHDTILEVGNARDLGFCKSVKKDGEYCNSWVNRKRTEFCEFHMNLALGKHRQARNDINSFNTGLGPRSGDKNEPFKKYKNSHRLGKWEEHTNDPGKRSRGNYDRDTGSKWFINKPSAATMLDNEVLGGQVAGRVERSEALRRRLATEEKERNLMKKLGKLGSGAGKEYMLNGQQRSNQTTKFGSSVASAASSGCGSTQGTDDQPKQLDAKSLGLIREKGQEPKMHLSPVKRKRVDSAVSSTSGTANGIPNPKVALGWGGSLKDKLARMKDGEKLRGGAVDNDDGDYDHFGGAPDEAGHGAAEAAAPRLQSQKQKQGRQDEKDKAPARKKTRFVTEKGIREAGRESLGTELGNDAAAVASASGGKAFSRRMVMLDDEDEGELLILD